MISVTETLSIDENDIQERFIRASGPGGQNVNKVATAVQLRFDAGRCASLSEAARERLRRAAGRRMTADGILVIEARRFRTLERNRKDAMDRLLRLIRAAVEPPRPRKRTRLPPAERRRRLDDKRRRAKTKRLRRDVGPESD